MYTFKRCKHEFIKGLLFIACDYFLFFMIAGLFTPNLFIRHFVAAFSAILAAFFVFIVENTTITLTREGFLLFKQGFRVRHTLQLASYHIYFTPFSEKQIFPTQDLRLYFIPLNESLSIKDAIILECSPLGGAQYANLVHLLKAHAPIVKEIKKDSFGRISL